MRVLLEVCVDSPAGLATACAHGADRIELCAALDLGGLTPSPGLMRLAAQAPLPSLAMIRPRAGDFCWSETEVQVMEGDIDAAGAAGLAGVVLGANLKDGRLDVVTLQRLTQRALGLGLTLHRGFDLVPDPFEALEQAIDVGFARILTSGAKMRAADGVALLAQLIERAAGRIIIMPGAGISAATLPAFAGLPLREIHASGGVAVLQSGPAVDFGFSAAQARQTDAASLQDLRAALDARG